MNRTLVLSALSAIALLGAVTFAEARDLIPEVGPQLAAVQPGPAPSLIPEVGATTTARSSGAFAAERASGIQWLLGHQRDDGGWGAGNWGADITSAPSDVATTVIASQALMRDGTSKHAAALARATDYVVTAIETAPAGPRLNTPPDTQPQHKLGALVDTHLAALFLGEIIPSLTDPALRIRANQSYDAVLTKVQQAQQSDGSFEASGWAPVLSTSIAAQSLVRAQEQGRDVADDVIARAEEYQAGQLGSGGFGAGGGAAGVELYAVAGTAKASNEYRKAQGAASTGMKDNVAAANARVSADVDGSLVQGFGSMGGEEMLAYMMISDTLAETDAGKYADWEQKIGGHLAAIQNGDGSWSGHHCITSTTFVTAAALMTLGAGDFAVATGSAAKG
jgi:hypothetical protein